MRIRIPRWCGIFTACISKEMKEQILEKEGRLPDAMIACVGGGSNAIGAFYEFLQDRDVQADWRGSGRTRDGTRANMRRGSRAECRECCRGRCRTYLQDEDGQIAQTHSVSAGLDYASIGPEHAALHDSGRAEYVSQDDAATLDAVVKLARTEGILPALESAHAVAECLRIAGSFKPHDILMVNLSGRGDKDMGIIARELKL